MIVPGPRVSLGFMLLKQKTVLPWLLWTMVVFMLVNAALDIPRGLWFGVASSSGFDEGIRWFLAAANAASEAKRSGKNRVVRP